MVFDSIALMTMFDVVILGIVAYVVVHFARARRRLDVPGARAGFAAMLFGLTTVGAFYLADLITMHVLPRFVPMSTAMAVMRDLHLNHRWFVTLIGVGSIGLGLVATSKSLVTLVSDMKTTERRLRIARDQALSAAEAKSMFLANMSHELRTPLNAIIGFSETMKEQTFGPVGSTRYREYSEDIHRSGGHLLNIIDEILDLSKIESGIVDLNEEALDVASVVDGVLTFFHDRAVSRAVTLEADVPENLPGLYADGTRLRQMLINVISNAVKFTGAGGRVRVTCACDAIHGHVFEVADTGVGIAHKDIPLVFAVFGQVKNDMVNAGEGTGLGLPLVKSLVELHGGFLHLESKVGVGTTVSIAFSADRIVDGAVSQAV